MNYKDMSRSELASEMLRVKTLMTTKHDSHTYHQNKKYLVKLEKEWKRRYGKY